MNENLPKIKKTLSYLLMGIGAVAILGVVIAFVLQLSPRQFEFRSPLFRSESIQSPLFTKTSTTKPAAESVVTEVSGREGLAEKKIIKKGSLSLLVKKVEEAVKEIKAIAENLKGIVDHADIREVSDGIKSGRVTIRIPSNQFDAAMAAIQKLASKILDDETGTQDVTEEFGDLEAQLKNLRAEESQYLKIMKQAKQVEDVLKVSKELSNVRGQIERIEGQLKFLSRQVQMSQINVSLTAEADVEIFGMRWQPLFVVKESLRNLLEGLTAYIDAIIAIVFYLPVLLLWATTIAAILLLGFRLWKWIRGRSVKK